MDTLPVAARANADWLADLGSPGPDREAALAELRAIVLAGLPHALAGWLSPGDPQFEALAEDTTQETLIRVLAHVDSFEGRSQFTTWVYKIAVRVALTELRRRRWRDVSLESVLEMEGEAGADSPGFMADPEPGPEARVERAELLARLRRIIGEELTPKQGQAMMAIGIKGMPMDEVARQMGTNRNALYKLLHDARLRLKRRMAREGLTPENVLAVFERK